MPHYHFGIVSGWDEERDSWIIKGVLDATGEEFYAASPKRADKFLWPKSKPSGLELHTGQLVVFETFYFDFIQDVLCSVAPPLPDHLPEPKDIDPNLLIDAVKAGNLEKVRRLLDDGAVPDGMAENGNTALLHAVAKQNEPMINLLALYGADPIHPNDQGETAHSLAQERFPHLLPAVNAAPQPTKVKANEPTYAKKGTVAQLERVAKKFPKLMDQIRAFQNEVAKINTDAAYEIKGAADFFEVLLPISICIISY